MVFGGHKDLQVVTGSEHKALSNTALRDKQQHQSEVNFADVTFHSVSGWGKPDYEQTRRRLTALSERCTLQPLIQKQTHQKGIVVDEALAVFGSFGFLNNAQASRKETSAKLCEAGAIQEVCEEFMTQKAVRSDTFALPATSLLMVEHRFFGNKRSLIMR